MEECGRVGSKRDRNPAGDSRFFERVEMLPPAGEESRTGTREEAA